jgi:hypothetical protein
MSTEDRVAGMFALVDIDKSGHLDSQEVVNFIAMGDDEDPDVATFKKEADENTDGQVTVQELQDYFKKKEAAMDTAEFNDYIERCEDRAKFAKSQPSARTDATNESEVLDGQPVPSTARTDASDASEVLDGQPIPSKEEGDEEADDAVIDGMPIKTDGDDVLDGQPVKATAATPLLAKAAPSPRKSADNHWGRRLYAFSALLAYTLLFLLFMLWFWVLPYSMGFSGHNHTWSVWFPLGILLNVLLPLGIWMHCVGCRRQEELQDSSRAIKGFILFLVLALVFVGAFLLGVVMRGVTEEAIRVLDGDNQDPLCASISPHSIPDVTTGTWASGSYVYEGHVGWVLDRSTCIVMAPVLADTAQNNTDGCHAVLGNDGTTTVRFWAYIAETVSADITDCSHINLANQQRSGAIIKASDPVWALREHELEEWGNIKSQLDTAKEHFFTTGGTASNFVDGGYSRYVEMSNDPEGEAAQGAFYLFSLMFAVPVLAMVVVLGLCALHTYNPDNCCFKYCGLDWMRDDSVHFDNSMQDMHDASCCAAR